VISGSAPLEDCVPAAVAAAFPDGFGAAPPAVEAASGAEDGGAGGEKKDAWEKQLLEHCLFRVLGARPAARAKPPRWGSAFAHAQRLSAAQTRSCARPWTPSAR